MTIPLTDPFPAAAVGVPPKRLQFSYDYQGRLIRRQVFSGTYNPVTGTINWSGTPDATAGADLLFLYDGPLRIVALKPDQSLYQAYVWGLDLSGTLTGAGGVGGLVMFRRTVGANTETYFPTYDGNGNVTGLVKGEDASVSGSGGTVAARYEYGPFGQLLRISGEPLALDNPFRFSTKYQDDASDLLYYGFRFYSPSTGRWLSRDPIEEDGGINLLGFVGNDPVAEYDAFGLFLPATHRRLTKEALAASGVKLSEKCKDKILKILTTANTGQDDGAAFEALERHFNRPSHELETGNEVVSRRMVWDGKFRSYVSSEVQSFGEVLSSTPPNCTRALEALGRATHSWQDFYAHAISSAHTPRHNKVVGFQAWTFFYGGSPDYHPRLWPSSYNSPYAWKEGEHPNRREPVIGREAVLRESAAASFVAGKYGTFLQQWLKACPCWCDSKR